MNKQNGFTLIEILAVLTLFLVVILLVGSMYILAQQAYIKSSHRAELTQNARVCLDRLSRELRQSIDLVTGISSTTASNEILFQDGHDINQITYIRYYLNGTDLMRSHLAYHFEAPTYDPDIYVLIDSIDIFSATTTEEILENRIVGEYFNNINFLGSDGLISISIKLEKSNNKLNIDSKIYIRNW